VKLILANNQSDTFTSFYETLQQQTDEPFDYAGYSSLLFVFDTSADQPIRVVNLQQGKELTDYDGVYINGYLNTYELAASVAIACEALNIGYANRELSQPASLSKLSMYAKLAVDKVTLPFTIAGTKAALLVADAELSAMKFPAVLKRADADRGIDNYKVASVTEAATILAEHDDRSLWVLQEFVDNQGFYLVSFFNDEPTFCIFRSLEARPDGNEQKAHMYKPKGGANARLIPLEEVPTSIIDTCARAARTMNRQIASVDCLYDEANDVTYILEVNYNPQLVTIETFKAERIATFLKNLPDIGKK
jgi:glutathione synthase/RimK-type ligase-like ATP-grasp enzyme